MCMWGGQGVVYGDHDSPTPSLCTRALDVIVYMLMSHDTHAADHLSHQVLIDSGMLNTGLLKRS